RGLAMIRTLKETVVVLLMLSMSLIGMPTVVLAAPIGTDTVVQLDKRGELVSRIQAQLARDDVRAQFLARGVSPAEVDARIAALSTEELQMLSLQLDDLPAGGSVLAVIGVVFVVLLILELVGVTNVFTEI
ncbi:MAG: PA2779 family protein, partial [Sedimenticolaceae bacterium]